MSLVSSTGEEFTLAEKGFRSLRLGRTPDRVSFVLRYSLLMAQIPEGTDVGDDERDAELILRAHLPEIDAAIFHSQATATAVVTELKRSGFAKSCSPKS